LAASDGPPRYSTAASLSLKGTAIGATGADRLDRLAHGIAIPAGRARFGDDQGSDEVRPARSDQESQVAAERLPDQEHGSEPELLDHAHRVGDMRLAGHVGRRALASPVPGLIE